MSSKKQIVHLFFMQTLFISKPPILLQRPNLATTAAYTSAETNEKIKKHFL
jgi:hypothetical protein